MADRHGKNIGRVAAASQLVTFVYYGLRDYSLRDGNVRCLAATEE